MKKIDAYWELDNIGSRVLEIIIEKDDCFHEGDFNNIPCDYDYIVVKVPTNKTEFNWYLGGKGYTMIETQLELHKNIHELDINDRYLKRMIPYVGYERVNSESKIEEILARINPNMFVTDRISLDPHYGPIVGCRRYKNYIKSSFDKNKLEIIAFYFKEKLVGFEMHEVKGTVCHGKLGGVFSDVNIPGLGFLTTCAPLIYTNTIYGVDVFRPFVSINNSAIIKLYNYYRFLIYDVHYVFVKHCL